MFSSICEEFDDNDRDDDGNPIGGRRRRGEVQKDNAVFLEGLDIADVEQLDDRNLVSNLQHEIKLICSFKKYVNI